ncbi:MAG TPA: prefoldin subunit beta [Candidatus Nanoarchaeia archaeon]|nr:prefoldin subunit beta [Candidatus Nanoarchaeia archaeon]
MDVSKETEQKINQLQMFEQGLQNLLVQRQQFQSQLVEVESALSELKDSKESYKIIGNIMVAADKNGLQKELESKKETTQLRIKTLEKQEKSIKEKAEKLQQEVLEKMEK